MMHSRYSALIALVFTTTLLGCGGAPALPRGAVQGQVTVAGQPLAAGRILFIPLAPTVGPTVSAQVINGRYTLSQDQGPVAGDQRVEVEAELNLGFAFDDELAFAQRGGQPLPPNPIPPEFNVQSKLTTQIAESASNTFDIAVPAARRW
jgi:hypothetical protein